jgi:hypothetical protein
VDVGNYLLTVAVAVRLGSLSEAGIKHQGLLSIYEPSLKGQSYGSVVWSLLCICRQLLAQGMEVLGESTSKSGVKKLETDA